MSVFLSPFTVTLDISHNHASVFVSDAYFSTIGTPSHVSHVRSLSIVYHFLHPLSIVLHPHDYCSSRVTGGQLTILVVPSYECQVALVIRQVDTLRALIGSTCIFNLLKSDKLEKPLVRSNRKPSFIAIPSTRRCRALSRHCYFFLQERKHFKSNKNQFEMSTIMKHILDNLLKYFKRLSFC